jgi:collagenase-like PrtC family protease
MFEDEHGTYIMNSKDLRAIHHVDYLTKMGVDCFKIEGRTKSFFYAARTAQLYDQAIKDSLAGKPFDMSLMDKLEGLAHRGYTEGSTAVMCMMNIKSMTLRTLAAILNSLSEKSLVLMSTPVMQI